MSTSLHRAEGCYSTRTRFTPQSLVQNLDDNRGNSLVNRIHPLHILEFNV